MKQLYFLIVRVMLIFPITLVAQPNDIVPVSPEAAALTKMVDYPVNLNTGVPDISIPFYEINVGGLKLPITLQYHAGGFKINERATRAGLGWSLSSDLQITRTINGDDDLSPGGYIHNSLVKPYYTNPSNCPSCDYPLNDHYRRYELGTGHGVIAPDKFSYKLLGKSGSFYFQKNNAGTGYTIVPVPFDNIKIHYNDGAFVITDTDGTVYYFGEPGVALTEQIAAKGIEYSGTEGSYRRTAWKCKRIVSSNGTDAITFTYASKQVARYKTYHDRVEYYNNADPCGLSSGEYYRSDVFPMNNPYWDYQAVMGQIPFHRISSPKYLVYFGNAPKSYFHVPYLNGAGQVVDRVYEKTESVATGQTMNVEGVSVTEIGFRGGKVEFSGIDKLDYIRVLDHNNAEVRSLHFFHSYATPIYLNESRLYNGPNFQGTMYLDSLHLRNGMDTYERYALYYTSKFCYGNHLKGHDAWGYPNAVTKEIALANNTTGNVLSLPTMNIVQERFYRTVAQPCNSFVANVPIVIGGNDWAEAPDKEAMKRGVLRRIVYPTGGFTDFDLEPNQYTEEFSGTNYHSYLPQLSGGLRVRAVNHYDADGNHRGQQYYRYGMVEEGTGVLLNRPARAPENGRFHYGAVGYQQELAYLRGPSPGSCSAPDYCLSVLAVETKTTYEPASVLDYTYADGAPIYYQKVTEYRQDQEQMGKTVHEYYPPGHFYDHLDPLYNASRIPGTNMRYLQASGLMGRLKSVKTFRSNGVAAAGYTKVQQKEYEYQRYLRPEQLRVVYAFMRVLYSVPEGNYSGNMQDIYATNFLPEPNYVYGQYGIPCARLLESRVTETAYEGTDSLQTVTEYSYANLPYLQPSAISTWDSRDGYRTKSIRYAHNFTGTVYSDMVAANMVSQQVEEAEQRDGEVWRRKTNYAEYPVGTGLIAPSSVQSSVNGAPLRTVETFDEYDQYGNLLQSTGMDGVPVSYLWGYSHLYPVARLEGVRYSQIPGTYKNNGGIVNPTDGAALQTLLGGLRTALAASGMIATYSYRPLVGMTRQVDANGQSVSYEYDGIGRLHLKKDHDGQLLSRYEYHMKGPRPPWANTVLYTNVPDMRTFRHEVSPGMWQFYNRFVPGGTHVTEFGQAIADMATREDVNSREPVRYPVGQPPVPMSEMATVQLFYSIDSYVYGGNTELLLADFIQDGSIVATYRINPSSLPQSFFTLYVPAGEYQLSIRASADVNYRGGCLHYSFLGGGGQYSSNAFVRPGTRIVLQAGEFYECLVSTRYAN